MEVAEELADRDVLQELILEPQQAEPWFVHPSWGVSPASPPALRAVNSDVLNDIMTLVDDVADRIGDGRYVELAGLLKKMYDSQPRHVELQVGSYYYVSPDLQTYLEIDVTRVRAPGFELCVRYEGCFQEIPQGEWLGDRAQNTWQERYEDGAVVLRNGSGPYHKFTPNINYMWLLCERHPDNLKMPTLWLEEWMLNLIYPIRSGHFFDRVVTFPNCFGWHHDTFIPLRPGQIEPSLYTRFHDHDRKDLTAQAMLRMLPDNHRLRWVSSEKGNKHGPLWKRLRQHLQAKIIARFWWRIATRKRSFLKRDTRRVRELLGC